MRRNGELVEPTSFGVARKIDPGDYRLTAELHGDVVWQRRVVLAERDRARFLVPRPAPDRAPAAPPPPAQRPAKKTSGETGSRVPLYAAAGLGAAGLAVGSLAGVVAMGKKASIDRDCPSRACNPAGRKALSAARGAATVSTIGFAAAGAGGVAALVLVLVSPPDAKERSGRRLSPLVVSNGHGLSLLLEGSME